MTENKNKIALLSFNLDQGPPFIIFFTYRTIWSVPNSSSTVVDFALLSL